MEWARMLAYITGTVDQELLLRNESEISLVRLAVDWAARPSASGDGCPAGYHSGLVSKARRSQIRWLEASKPRPATDRQSS